MKQRIVIALICLVQAFAMNAQKKLYIPNEWKNPWPSDSLLYKEVDTDNKYTWSKSRSKESDNFIVYWDKYYGKTIPTNASSTYKVDIDDLLKKAEGFYALNVGQLAFCDESNSKVSKYKMMILVNHTTDWVCYGGGYDNTIGALWLSPSTCKPVGHSVAHEVGHSFQYQCFSDLGGNAGFRGAIGVGSTFWEQTAQWQANQAYPELKWDQSWGIFKHTANYAMTHEWMRYQSYWWHYYLAEKYGIDFIGKIWRHQMAKVADANEVLMDMMGYGAEGLYKDYFDYAMKMATLDLDVARAEANPYIGTYDYDYLSLGETKYQVAYSSCPQSTGFNVIPLNVPAAGTEITTAFTSLKKTATLADGDPVKYFNGESRYVNLAGKKFYNCYSDTKYNSQRAFRIGYVALLKDGTRQYLYEDKLYCAEGGAANITEEVKAVVPENTKKLYLVVVPAPKTYYQHKWDPDKDSNNNDNSDNNISNDDQWPYTIEFTNTNISGAPTISDDMSISDVTLTYDVYFPRASDYSGTTVTIEGSGASALGTAFQMQVGDIAGKMVGWASAGPKDGQIMFYAVNADGKISNTASSANGYGHWFTSTGTRCAYGGTSYLYSEFAPNSTSFAIGQYPSRVTNNKDYTIRQALKYVRGTETALATFIFRVHITSSKTGYELAEVQTPSIDTGINDNDNVNVNDNIYTLDGRLVKNINNYHGLYIKGGKKQFR